MRPETKRLVKKISKNAAVALAAQLAAFIFISRIRRENKVKLIISDSGCESVKKIYAENGVNNSSLLYGKIRKCCVAALDEEKIGDKAEVSLTVVGNGEIRELNREHRQKDSVTDVLSFPLGENGEFDVDPETNRIMLGDIVISAERAAEQAKEYGHSFEREMCFLAVHSMFHLLGYDHEAGEEEEKIMFDKQRRVLDKLGINR
ncbi:MAG: rRNA maturation RNase YbeY [Bacteroides sp.]|nr:rRNA maturation RNase YbeY [Bacteroides sp.]